MTSSKILSMYLVLEAGFRAKEVVSLLFFTYCDVLPNKFIGIYFNRKRFLQQHYDNLFFYWIEEV